MLFSSSKLIHCCKQCSSYLFVVSFFSLYFFVPLTNFFKYQLLILEVLCIEQKLCLLLIHLPEHFIYMRNLLRTLNVRSSHCRPTGLLKRGTCTNFFLGILRKFVENLLYEANVVRTAGPPVLLIKLDKILSNYFDKNMCKCILSLVQYKSISFC